MNLNLKPLVQISVLAAALSGCSASAAPPIEVTGKWEVTINPGPIKADSKTVAVPRQPEVLHVAPPDEVTTGMLLRLPLWNQQAPGWARGYRLDALRTVETTAPDHLVPGSVKVLLEEKNPEAYQRGVDYEIDEQWGTIGRLSGGRISETTWVWVDYALQLDRIDSIVAHSDGRFRIMRGPSQLATAQPPAVPPSVTVVANIWVPANLKALAPEHIYPIQQSTYQPPSSNRQPQAPTLLPKTWRKLNQGGTVRVLAWGDSVTAGGEVSDDRFRWQNQFVQMLRKRFPRADIQLTTVAWGGRNSLDFLKEPPGSSYNFQEKVLNAAPDLIISEFVNDAFMNPEAVEENYSRLLEDFRQIGAEWIILTPHYVWPRWMGSPTARTEEDPRPYVAGLRQFADKHDVALADASLRWGHLVKEGIPYTTLLVNSLNHPDDRGHTMFALSLMELFGPGD